jgi:hypothetical protein
MAEGKGGEGFTRRELFRRGGEAALVTGAAAVGLPESARADTKDPKDFIEPPPGNIFPEQKQESTSPKELPSQESIYEKSTQNFIRGLVQLVARLDEKVNLLQAPEMEHVEKAYLDAFCEERGVLAKQRTPAIDTLALIHALGEVAMRYPNIDVRISILLSFRLEEASEHSAQASLDQWQPPTRPDIEKIRES